MHAFRRTTAAGLMTAGLVALTLAPAHAAEGEGGLLGDVVTGTVGGLDDTIGTVGETVDDITDPLLGGGSGDGDTGPVTPGTEEEPPPGIDGQDGLIDGEVEEPPGNGEGEGDGWGNSETGPIDEVIDTVDDTIDDVGEVITTPPVDEEEPGVETPGQPGTDDPEDTPVVVTPGPVDVPDSAPEKESSFTPQGTIEEVERTEFGFSCTDGTVCANASAVSAAEVAPATGRILPQTGAPAHMGLLAGGALGLIGAGIVVLRRPARRGLKRA